MYLFSKIESSVFTKIYKAGCLNVWIQQGIEKTESLQKETNRGQVD